MQTRAENDKELYYSLEGGGNKVGETSPHKTAMSINFKQELWVDKVIYCLHCRSQWPRGLRPRYSSARLLRLWVRIPPGSWMFVCCECYVLSGRGLCDGLITRPEEYYRLWRVVVCDQETSSTRRLKPATGLWKYNHSGFKARKTKLSSLPSRLPITAKKQVRAVVVPKWRQYKMLQKSEQ